MNTTNIVMYLNSLHQDHSLIGLKKFNLFNQLAIVTKTPLFNGVSPLNWRKRVRVELTNDITATH